MRAVFAALNVLGLVAAIGGLVGHFVQRARHNPTRDVDIVLGVGILLFVVTLFLRG